MSRLILWKDCSLFGISVGSALLGPYRYLRLKNDDLLLCDAGREVSWCNAIDGRLGVYLTDPFSLAATEGGRFEEATSAESYFALSVIEAILDTFVGV